MATRLRDGAHLFEQMWSALDPGYRVAAVVIDPAKGPASVLKVSA